MRTWILNFAPGQTISLGEIRAPLPYLYAVDCKGALVPKVALTHRWLGTSADKKLPRESTLMNRIFRIIRLGKTFSHLLILHQTYNTNPIMASVRFFFLPEYIETWIRRWFLASGFGLIACSTCSFRTFISSLSPFFLERSLRPIEQSSETRKYLHDPVKNLSWLRQLCELSNSSQHFAVRLYQTPPHLLVSNDPRDNQMQEML